MRKFPGTNQTLNKRTAVGASVASATKYTDVLDLGVQHNYDRICGIKRGVASANETWVIEQCHNGDAPANEQAWVLAPMLVTGGMQSSTYRQQGEACVSPPSGTDMVVWVAPGARWIRGKHVNGDTEQTALALELNAYPS